MVDFHVPTWIFIRVKKGNKLHEYRDYKPYWIKRLSNINPPIMGNIVLGYTNEKIPITIVKKRLIYKKEIPEQSYRDFITTEQCYDIEYTIGN